MVAAQAGLAVSVVFCFHRPLFNSPYASPFFSTLVFKVVPCQSSPWQLWFLLLVKFSSAHCAQFFTVLIGFHLWSGTTGSQPIQLVFLRGKLCFLELVGVEPPCHLPYSRLHIWVVLSWLEHIYFYCSLVCVDSGGLTSSFNWLAFYDSVFDLSVLWSIAISYRLAMYFPFCMSISYWEHS